MTVGWCYSKPAIPTEGQIYTDSLTMISYIYCNSSWMPFLAALDNTPPMERFVPTKEELNQLPALKEAWEDYLILKRLYGI
jgi:hypothetical protein